jgi:hypothetical protein
MKISLESNEEHQVPEPPRRVKRAAAKAAADNIRCIEEFLEDEPDLD